MGISNYKNGKLNDWSTYYCRSGMKSEDLFYRDDSLLNVIFYDTITGNPIYKSTRIANGKKQIESFEITASVCEHQHNPKENNQGD